MGKEKVVQANDAMFAAACHWRLPPNQSAEQVMRMLMQHNIVVDSICIGREVDSSLRAASIATGGYMFVPSSIEKASTLDKLEPVLSLLECIAIKRGARPSTLNSTALKQRAKPDEATRDRHPARKAHESLNDSLVCISQLERIAYRELTQSASAVNISVHSRRLLLEV